MNKVIVSILAVALLVSCKKVQEEVEKDRIMAQDNHLAEDNADDISVISDEAYSNNELKSRGGSGGSGIMGDSVKITRNNADSTITIDFGTGVESKRTGKIRKGKIIVKFTGGYWKTGAVITQSFDNYSVNDNKIEGSRSITNNGVSNGIPSWSIQSNLTITKTDGKKITWNSTRTRTMTKGYSTPFNWSDDEYEISGSANGITSAGDIYTLTIDKPLFIKLSFNGGISLCKYILDGKITYTRGASTATLDYGTGGTASCDNQYTLTYLGKSYLLTF